MSDTDRLRDIAAFMREFGFGRGDTGDAPHVEAAADEIDRLRAALRPFAQGHLYADEELKHLPDVDAAALNPYDPDRSPTVGDCRRAAELLAATPLAPGADGR